MRALQLDGCVRVGHQDVFVRHLSLLLPVDLREVLHVDEAAHFFIKEDVQDFDLHVLDLVFHLCVRVRILHLEHHLLLVELTQAFEVAVSLATLGLHLLGLVLLDNIDQAPMAVPRLRRLRIVVLLLGEDLHFHGVVALVRGSLHDPVDFHRFKHRLFLWLVVLKYVFAEKRARFHVGVNWACLRSLRANEDAVWDGVEQGSHLPLLLLRLLQLVEELRLGLHVGVEDELDHEVNHGDCEPALNRVEVVALFDAIRNHRRLRRQKEQDARQEPVPPSRRHEEGETEEDDHEDVDHLLPVAVTDLVPQDVDAVDEQQNQVCEHEHHGRENLDQRQVLKRENE